MAARITKYPNKYVRRVLCLIYMFNFYFWSPTLARKMQKTNMRYYQEYPSRSWHPIIMVVELAILTYPTIVFYF
jgi:hypothetical protein